MDLILLLLFCLPTVQAMGNASKRKIRVDKEHLKLDFLDIFGSWSSVFNEAEMDFRYFAAHDYDNNKKLDGLELFIALGHDSHGEEAHQTNEEDVPSEEIEKQVDDIFQDHDSDNDGFLTYKEFMSVQRTHDIRGEGKNDGKPTSQEL